MNTPHTEWKGTAMLALVLLTAVVTAIVVPTLVTVSRDGYRRTRS